jgi:hypothetical protein
MMTDFICVFDFINELKFYVGSRLWREDQFSMMKELLQEAGLNVELLRGNDRDQYEPFNLSEK